MRDASALVTAFFNLISGFFRPTAGTILFDGRDVTALPASRKAVEADAQGFHVAARAERHGRPPSDCKAVAAGSTDLMRLVVPVPISLLE
jgi:hypothetical protein